MKKRHVVLVHPALCFSGQTERLVATARALEDDERRVTIVSSPGTRTRALEEAGYRPVFAELTPEPWSAPFSLRRTRRLLERLEPDVVHATADALAPLLSEIVPRLGIPWVQELHTPVRGRLAGLRSPFATTVVVSDTLVESAVNHGGVPRSQVVVVKNAPARDESVPARRPFDHGGIPRIGCSGLLDDVHATRWFLEAARLMVLSGTRAMFLVMGEGPNEGALRRFVRHHGLTEQVTIGVPTTRSAAESLAALDVHVSCKLDGNPGWLACQALAQGVPSIFVAAGDAFDLIEDKSNGVLVEPDNARRLADELTLLVTQRDRAVAMGAKGRARLEEAAPAANFAREVRALHEHLAAAPQALKS